MVSEETSKTPKTAGEIDVFSQIDERVSKMNFEIDIVKIDEMVSKMNQEEGIIFFKKASGLDLESCLFMGAVVTHFKEKLCNGSAEYEKVIIFDFRISLPKAAEMGRVYCDVLEAGLLPEDLDGINVSGLIVMRPLFQHHKELVKEFLGIARGNSIQKLKEEVKKRIGKNDPDGDQGGGGGQSGEAPLAAAIKAVADKSPGSDLERLDTVIGCVAKQFSTFEIKGRIRNQETGEEKSFSFNQVMEPSEIPAKVKLEADSSPLDLIEAALLAMGTEAQTE